jgi:phage-related protein
MQRNISASLSFSKVGQIKHNINVNFLTPLTNISMPEMAQIQSERIKCCTAEKKSKKMSNNSSTAI